METTTQSEFISKVTTFAEELAKMTEGGGNSRSVIIVATDPESEDTTAACIAVAGNARSLSIGVAELARNAQTKEIVLNGLKMAAAKDLCEALGKAVAAAKEQN